MHPFGAGIPVAIPLINPPPLAFASASFGVICGQIPIPLLFPGEFDV
jgi:hypothetical protein